MMNLLLAPAKRIFYYTILFNLPIKKLPLLESRGSDHSNYIVYSLKITCQD